MKLSKALLGAILVGVAVQVTTTSCTKKDNDLIKPQAGIQSEQQSSQTPEPNPVCPACGMG
jgi:hypothetical protein